MNKIKSGNREKVVLIRQIIDNLKRLPTVVFSGNLRQAKCDLNDLQAGMMAYMCMYGYTAMEIRKPKYRITNIRNLLYRYNNAPHHRGLRDSFMYFYRELVIELAKLGVYPAHLPEDIKLEDDEEPENIFQRADRTLNYMDDLHRGLLSGMDFKEEMLIAMECFTTLLDNLQISNDKLIFLRNTVEVSLRRAKDRVGLLSVRESDPKKAQLYWEAYERTTEHYHNFKTAMQFPSQRADLYRKTYQETMDVSVETFTKEEQAAFFKEMLREDTDLHDILKSTLEEIVIELDQESLQ